MRHFFKSYWTILIILLLISTNLHSQLIDGCDANAINIFNSESTAVPQNTTLNSDLPHRINLQGSPVLDTSNIPKAELSIGVGLLDFLFLGFKYGKRTAVGLNICFVDLFGVVGYDEPRLKFLTINPSIYYHFGGKSLYSDQKPWYLRGGITYFNARPAERYLIFTARIGRKLFFDERFLKNKVGRVGIDIDVGINSFLWSNYQDPWNLTEILKTFPGAGISFFYKF